MTSRKKPQSPKPGRIPARIAKHKPNLITVAQATLITPELAQELLAGNRNVRSLSTGHAMVMHRDMEAGNFPFTGAPIVVDKDWNLLDGQHRLTACVTSGRPFSALIVLMGDVSAGLMSLDGDQRLRSVTVATRGVHLEDPGLATAIAVRLFQAENFGLDTIIRTPAHAKPSRHEVNKIASRCADEINAAVPVANKLASLMPKNVAGLIYVLVARLDQDRADAFCEKLATGVNLRAGSPIYQARERLIALRMAQASAFKRRAHALILCSKAWNHWLSGSDVRLRVELGKSVPEFESPEPSPGK